MLAVVVAAASCGGGRTPLGGGVESPPTPGRVPPPSPGLSPDQAGGCGTGSELCGRGAAARCFDLQTSPGHCGACGNACPPGIACEAGKCRYYRCRGQVTMKAFEVRSDSWSLYQVALGDLDGDGYLDLISGSDPKHYPDFDDPASTSSFLGAGDGTFVTKDSFPVSQTRRFAAVADLNRDGALDVVSTSPTPDSLRVHLGSGDGSFFPGTDYGTGPNPATILLADFDADGNVDMASADIGHDHASDGAVSLRFGRGDGTFGERTAFPVAGSPAFLLYLDWNQDGIPDLVAADDTLHILPGLGDGAFAKAIDCGISRSHLSVSDWGIPLVVADFDGDGRFDLAVVSRILFGMNGCAFADAFDVPGPSPVAGLSWGRWPLLAGDLNGDGLPDLVMAEHDTVALLTANGSTSFAGPLTLARFDRTAICDFSAGAGDLNGDGRLDLFVKWYGGIRVLVNTCR